MKNKIGEANWNALRPVLIFVAFILLPCAVFAWFDYPLGNWIADHHWAQDTFIWVVFCLFTGWAEAYYFDAKIRSTFDLKVNEHAVFNVFRFFVWFLIFIDDWKTACALVLVFPFLHDGKLYKVRNKLNPNIYEHGWWSEPSHFSKAWVDLPLWIRLPLFGLGVYLLFLFNYQVLWR